MSAAVDHASSRLDNLRLQLEDVRECLDARKKQGVLEDANGVVKSIAAFFDKYARTNRAKRFFFAGTHEGELEALLAKLDRVVKDLTLAVTAEHAAKSNARHAELQEQLPRKAEARHARRLEEPDVEQSNVPKQGGEARRYLEITLAEVPIVGNLP